MDMTTQGSTSPPLQEKIVINNKIPRAIELTILSLLVFLLVYRVVTFKDQDHYFPWLLALLCESWFTFNWILVINAKWFQSMTKTYPERLLDRVNESEFPAVDIFVTTADPILEPSIITMNTVLSLLAVDYPAKKLALYLSDDACSPLIFYSLTETTKFAKIWVPFCKKYNVQVRAPFRYFTPNPPSMDDESLDFQQEWKKLKNEYGILYKKIEIAAQRTFVCDRDSDFAVFADAHRSNHPTIIKVVSENKEGTPSELPHVIYISREKNPKHHHRYKAGAMNVLCAVLNLNFITGEQARVSGVMTNAPLMLNVDCDMYANNPQVFLHAMCMFFGFKNEDDCGFVQFHQAFYNGLKDDPFGIQLVHLFYMENGITSMQGAFYGGSNCFHRRKVIYGSSPNDAIKTGNTDNECLHKMFGKSIEMRESAVQALSGSNAKMENRGIPSSSVEAAIQVAGCSYEYGTDWGKQIGWMYGSTAEDILTGISIHGRGWKSVYCVPDPAPFLGCAPVTYPAVLIQQKRWAAGLLEVFFTNKNPLLLAINGKLRFRLALVYMWLCFWAVRSIPEICYAVLPAYCIITNSRFLPEISEPAFLIPMGIFVIHTLYGFWEVKRLGVSVRMWWNIQRMGRVNTMTAWLFGYWNVILKVLGLSQMVFEVTPKDQSSSSNGDDIDDANAARFTYDGSPMIVPGVVILLVNLTALVSGLWGLVNVGSRENRMAVFGLGEVFCSVYVTLCFLEYLKGLFGNGKYGIPFGTIWKSGGSALLFVQLWRRSSQWF
ncbi:hypothetical protein OSB04_006119 [Centaurea solstitialis]|uniref:Cellulose synthase-like protein H1 n=1 Tax=Centaurea solstitialis TaxID=347529 RepID=A0AA38WRU5_9ASTR|nr:hypothetical protein OSB04_006119 [Centaurea solstitialis]